jgi:uncharacterized membrane protein
MVLTAIALPMLLVMTAFAVDLGMQRSLRRTMQARADVIALDLSRYLDGSSANALRSSATTATAKQASANRNNIDPVKVTVDWGNLNAVGKFFSGTTAAATAVQVTTTGTVDRFFQLGEGHATRIAVATADGIAGFEIGTKLASIDATQALALNGLMSDVLNGSFNLTALGYSGAVGSTVELADLSTALGFASPTELAGANVNARSFYIATANVLQQNGHTAAAGLFNSIALQTDQNLTFDMGDLMQVDAGGEDAALAAGVDAFDLLQGSIYAINGTNAISIPNLNLNIAGLAATSLTLHVTEAPRFVFGRVGANRTTSQARVDLTPTISTNLPGLGLLNTIIKLTASVPLSVSVAGAKGTLTAINCGASKSIQVGVDPQPVSVTAGITLDLKLLSLVPVADANIPASGYQLNGHTDAENFAYTSQFLPPVGTGSLRATSPTSLGLAGALNVPQAQIHVLSLPLGVSLSALTGALNTTLAGILGPLDTLLMGPLAHALGLTLGGADLGALDMLCGAPSLVG